jgi:hypothetical protein
LSVRLISRANFAGKTDLTAEAQGKHPWRLRRRPVDKRHLFGFSFTFV